MPTLSAHIGTITVTLDLELDDDGPPRPKVDVNVDLGSDYTVLGQQRALELLATALDGASRDVRTAAEEGVG